MHIAPVKHKKGVRVGSVQLLQQHCQTYCNACSDSPCRSKLVQQWQKCGHTGKALHDVYAVEQGVCSSSPLPHQAMSSFWNDGSKLGTPQLCPHQDRTTPPGGRDRKMRAQRNF
eukprot:1161373-Pelagomonas_calceolata.AAC.13